MSTEWLKASAAGLGERGLEKAARTVKAGGVIIYPTDTSYALGVDPFNPRAVDKVYRLKGRDYNNPLSLLIGDWGQLSDLVRMVPPAGELLTRAFWPGPLTLIFRAAPSLLPLSIGGGDKIALRLPGRALTRALIKAVGIPLTATSANPAGLPSPYDAQKAGEYFGDKPELIIDGGHWGRGLDSTIVDISVFPPLLIRAGAVSWEKIREALRGAV